jgi:hypothetical protein
MTNIGRSKAALRASAGLLVLMVGCGAAVVGVEQSAPTTGTSATTAMPSETLAPPPAPSGPTGGGGADGALRVVPVGGGGCVIGLNCGCIGRNCPPFFPQHHNSAPADGHPNNAPIAPRPSGGG